MSGIKRYDIERETKKVLPTQVYRGKNPAQAVYHLLCEITDNASPAKSK
jgi:hypothetical protein